ncbi:alpha/beta-hydrolase [Mycena haematopus]|nr:alpha/beta-hydrolase [Mycena haematopus]
MAPARKFALTKDQAAMYRQETLQNFRFIARIMSTYASSTLSTKDLAPMEVKDYLSEIGQFTEITYSTLPTQFIFDNLTTLMEPGFPLEGYHSVRDAKLVSAFAGKTADLPGYLVYRPHTKQLILAFSGSKTLLHAFYDLRALQHRHPSRRGKVHSGFWKLYMGTKPFALEAIRKGLAGHDVAELVITGHSMGAVVSQLFLIDILRDDTLVSIGSIPLKLVVFGAPRSGNEELVKYWCELLDNHRVKYGEASVSEYSVKAYNDGVPSLPPLAFGYRHYARSPLYFEHGRLYQVPAESRERNIAPEHPRGGHNYYNGRDMEKFARRTIWALETMKKGGDWTERYRAKVAKHTVS